MVGQASACQKNCVQASACTVVKHGILRDDNQFINRAFFGLSIIDNTMKIFAAFLSIVIAPAFVAAQQTSNDSKPCGISHWSTTGAACYYAPDLSPAEEAELKSSGPLWTRKDTLAHMLSDFDGLSPMKMPGELPKLKALPNSPDPIIQPKLWKHKSK